MLHEPEQAHEHGQNGKKKTDKKLGFVSRKVTVSQDHISRFFGGFQIPCLHGRIVKGHKLSKSLGSQIPDMSDDFFFLFEEICVFHLQTCPFSKKPGQLRQSSERHQKNVAKAGTDGHRMTSVRAKIVVFFVCVANK